jgi:putative membrane protein
MSNPSVNVATKMAATMAIATAFALAVPLSPTLAQTTGATGTDSTTTSTGRAPTGSAAGDNYGAAAVEANPATSKKFATEAIEGNIAETKLGQLAQKQSSNEAVRSYGAMLEKDHGAAKNEVKQAAQTIGVTPPSEPNAKQKAMYERLSKLSGAEFDKAFAKAMVEDHKKDIRKYEMESKQSDAVGAYAKATLPTLRHHLQMAEKLQKSNS